MSLVRREVAVSLPTVHGVFHAVGYRCTEDGSQHLALVAGQVEDARDVLVGLHPECLVGDVFGARSCDCHARLDASLEQIAANGTGVVVYVTKDRRDRLGQRQPCGASPRDRRLAAAILDDLAAASVRVTGTDAALGTSLEDAGIEVVEPGRIGTARALA